MSITNYPTVPAVYTSRSVAPRNIFKSGTPAFYPSLATLDGTKSRDTGNDRVAVLRAGLLMGKVTSGGKYAASVLGVTTNAEASGSTSIQAAAAVVTELVRRVGASGTFKLIGPPTAGGTVAVETVTYSAASGTDITVTATTAAFVAGSLICPTDGSETPTQLLTPQYGVPVTNEFGDSLDQTMRLLRGGDIDVTQIVNYPSDASLKAWVKAALRTLGGELTFSDDR
jgi:hypothetical protein